MESFRTDASSCQSYSKAPENLLVTTSSRWKTLIGDRDSEDLFQKFHGALKLSSRMYSTISESV